MTKPNFIVITMLAQKTAQGWGFSVDRGNREGCPYDDFQKTAQRWNFPSPFFVPQKPQA